MTCKDCIYEDICDLKQHHYYLGQPIEKIDCAEIGCKHFKVYCEKCKYRNKERFCFKCIDGVGYKIVLPTDYCNYSEYEEVV